MAPFRVLSIVSLSLARSLSVTINQIKKSLSPVGCFNRNSGLPSDPQLVRLHCPLVPTVSNILAPPTMRLLCGIGKEEEEKICFFSSKLSSHKRDDALARTDPTDWRVDRGQLTRLCSRGARPSSDRHGLIKVSCSRFFFVFAPARCLSSLCR